ncbi:NYN domain-containing protein [Dietzia maris]|uniref:NYN domain-containing protein n=1 Tax=Dietzia maris TaxID=37915 RepID=UPI0034490C7F
MTTVTGPRALRSRRSRVGRHRSTRPRTLHLVDLENLVGGLVSETLVTEVWEEYVRVTGLRAGDQVIVSVARRHAVDAFFALPAGIRRVIGSNAPDGADVALLAEVDVADVARRFGQVVIASGDHAFVPLARAITEAGIPVIQVIGAGLPSTDLYAACGSQLYLPGTRGAVRGGAA